jgi:hypothetical protein
MSSRLPVRLSAPEIRALLDALPRCSACRDRRGELVLGGRLVCTRCAPRGPARAETPAWTNAADALQEALQAQ